MTIEFHEFPKWIDLPGDVRKIVHSAEEEARELLAWGEKEVQKVEEKVKRSYTKKAAE